ncbi:MAG: hypothetical protein ACRDIU_03860 [Actinomycetota bacterium]
MKKNTRVSRGKVLAQAFTATVAAALLLVSGTSAFADQAKSSSADAFGLEATGLLPIAKTPSVSVKAPPDDVQRREVTLNVPSASLIVEALLVAQGEVHLNDGVVPFLRTSAVKNPTRQVDPAIGNVNTRAYASVDNLDLLGAVATGVDCNTAPQLCPSLLTVDLLETEAVAKCVNNQPQFQTGYNLLDLKLLNLELGTLVENVLQLPLNLLGPSGILSGVLSVEQGKVENILENGQQVGIRITGLQINVLGTTEVVRVAVSEARMPRDCGVAAPAPGPQLAVTGGGGVVSFAGAGVLAAAVLAIVFLRRWRPEV